MKSPAIFFLVFSFFVAASSITNSEEVFKLNKRFEKTWPNKADLEWLAQAKGKSEKEVIRLLGFPSRTETMQDGRTRWHYPWLASAFVDFKNGRAVWTFYTGGY